MEIVYPDWQFFNEMAQKFARVSYRVPQHRKVMADYLGRPLLTSETVHHKNGDRENNNIDNLQLRQGRHGNGMSYRCNSCGSFDVRAEDI